MNRIRTGLLVAASALLTISVAQAQDGPDGPHRDHRGGPGRVEGARPDGSRPDGRRSGPQPGQQPHDQPHPPMAADGGARFQGGAQLGVGGPRRDDGGNRFDRGDRGPPRDGGDSRFAGGGGQGAFRGPAQGDGHFRRPDGDNDRVGWRGGDRGQPGRPYFSPTGGQGGYRPQPGQPGFGHRPPGSGGPGFAPGAPRWGNPGQGGGWTRGWRDDRRYDWHNYRVENRFVFNLPRYYAPRGWGYGYRRFDIGVTIGAPLFAQDYWLDDPYDYRLPPAYGPYRWVRYFNDALLVDVRDGQVVDAVYGIFW